MDSDVRSYRLMLTGIIALALVLISITAGITIGVMYSTRQNQAARSECIAHGGTWIQQNCIGGK